MKFALLFVLILMASVAIADDQAPWVDMKGCPICVNVTNEEGLTENMSWEHHLTATGVMTVFTIKPDHKHKFDRAKGKMKKILGRVVGGEEIDVCGYCSSIASLLGNGAKAENIVTKTTDVTLISSVDEAVIGKIHIHGQKTIDFLEAGHKGHGH